MPDAWETQNGLNPDGASDGSATGKDGYTNLENYLNGLVDFKDATSIQPTARHPFSLFHHYANSLHSSLNIGYSIPEKSNVRLEVFDMRGKSVVRLVDAVKETGHYSVDFGGLNLSPGLYITKLTSSDRFLARRMYLNP